MTPNNDDENSVVKLTMEFVIFEVVLTLEPEDASLMAYEVSIHGIGY
jgi:hypothetical protein